MRFPGCFLEDVLKFQAGPGSREAVYWSVLTIVMV